MGLNERQFFQPALRKRRNAQLYDFKDFLFIIRHSWFFSFGSVFSYRKQYGFAFSTQILCRKGINIVSWASTYMYLPPTTSPRACPTRSQRNEYCLNDGFASCQTRNKKQNREFVIITSFLFFLHQCLLPIDTSRYPAVPHLGGSRGKKPRWY